MQIEPAFRVLLYCMVYQYLSTVITITYDPMLSFIQNQSLEVEHLQGINYLQQNLLLFQLSSKNTQKIIETNYVLSKKEQFWKAD